jgi:hypothetical protein
MKKVPVILGAVFCFFCSALGCNNPAPRRPHDAGVHTANSPRWQRQGRHGYVDAFTGSTRRPGAQGHPSGWKRFQGLQQQRGLYVPDYRKKLPIELKKYVLEDDTETLNLQTKMHGRGQRRLMFAPWGTSQNFADLPLTNQPENPINAHAAAAPDRGACPVRA